MRRNALAAAFCCGLIAAGATPAGALSAQSCFTAADCSSGQVCEDGTCVAPGCGSNSDCSTGMICSGGDCVAAPTASSVASCDVTPGTAPVTTPLPLTVAEPPLVQVKPAKGSPRPAESRASALSATVLPASTGAGFGVTSQLATDEAVGAATQAPPEQICPAPQSELLPQPGATQVPSSQTWPELQSLELKQTVTPWPTVAAKASVTTAAVVAAAATMIRINPSFHRCMEEVEFSCAGPPASRPTFAKTLPPMAITHRRLSG